ncbi:cytochrome C oxidase subunit IV family protein [Halomonas heilongjiangensis]|uniref:Cytochrome C oxidase subunit IV n=1 Tax=Halomonas heilongjiangensis TaxID=1387883 RepID=A0A2N7TRP6_9GAMM|nr:cytochrome C oxidase subunit IV family protein [Halomonas heilongjiangensis]PMR70798.1 cytochrome C oxidase subunit IV [Halomonas heilongjiangensis]PXX94018.1 cytochrome C oxidase subunit IV [Halomonas heilongjiangensis]
MAKATPQQHPLRIYLWVWLWLFVLSVFSYLVDVSGMEGFLKWFLITLFMLLKAGLIVAFFMHMAWERLAIIYTILVPPGVLLFLAGLMAMESNYTLVSRLTFFAN